MASRRQPYASDPTHVETRPAHLSSDLRSSPEKSNITPAVPTYAFPSPAPLHSGRPSPHPPKPHVATRPLTLTPLPSKWTKTEANTEPTRRGPHLHSSVILKLLFFTLAMVVAPLGTYFATVRTCFKGNSSWAGASAALVANVVLIGYIVAAVREDQGERAEGSGSGSGTAGKGRKKAE